MSTIKANKRKGRPKVRYIGENAPEKVVYRELVKAPLVEPHCNCQECHEYSGKTVTTVVKYGFGICRPTKLAKDKETCLFCGYYVLWQINGNKNRGNQHRVESMRNV